MSRRCFRPNPDELLVRVKAEEAKTKRGKLKNISRYARVWAKTYAMLETHVTETFDTDVVIGVVETHKRRTAALGAKPGDNPVGKK